MKILVVILTAIINALLPWLARKSQPSAQDGDPDIKTRDKLRKKVRDFWLISIIILMVPVMAGCRSVVYVPPGSPVRLRETIKNAKVWVKDADGQVVAGRMDLPEGWFCLPVDVED